MANFVCSIDNKCPPPSPPPLSPPLLPHVAGTLLVVDSEEEFFPAELEKVQRDVTEKGLSLVVFAGEPVKKEVTY